MTDTDNSDGRRGPAPDPKHYETIPALRVYIDRIGAEQINFRRFVVTQERGGYKADRVGIKVGPDGTLSIHGPDQKEFLPTADEQAAIKAAFVGLEFHKSIPALMVKVKALRLRLGVTEEDFFVLTDAVRKDPGTVMCQQRVEKEDGSKFYRPWTLFSDGEWYPMEPDDGLPLWKPSVKRHNQIMHHEGAKAARRVDWLCYSDEPEAKAARATHPWIEELRNYDHWGWIGGAPNPHRTNWSRERRM